MNHRGMDRPALAAALRTAPPDRPVESFRPRARRRATDGHQVAKSARTWSSKIQQASTILTRDRRRPTPGSDCGKPGPHEAAGRRSAPTSCSNRSQRWPSATSPRRGHAWSLPSPAITAGTLRRRTSYRRERGEATTGELVECGRLVGWSDGTLELEYVGKIGSICISTRRRPADHAFGRSARGSSSISARTSTLTSQAVLTTYRGI